MAERTSQAVRPNDNYYQLTRRPWPNLILISAMLLFFHVGAFFYGTEKVLKAPQYVGSFFVWLGAPAAFLPAAAVVGILLIQHLLHRHKWEAPLPVMAGIIGESILWTIPLIALSHVTGRIVAAGAPGQYHAFVQNLLLAAGASVYEEFLFRMVLIALMLLVLVDVMGLKKDPMTVLAVIVSGVAFSLCHFKIAFGAEEFQWRHFIFLAIAGTLWGVMFVFRGLGIAVGSHFFWDVYVLLAVGSQG